MSKATLNTEKKKRPHVLRSDESVKTSQYKKVLEQVYGKYIVIAPNASYLGPAHVIDHLCRFCGEITSAKPSTMLPNEKTVDAEGNISYNLKGHGRGCTSCRTNSDHIHALQQYQEELYRVHKKKFDFACLPMRFKVDNGRYREIFKCNDCGMQHYQLARAMLNPKFKCVQCEAKNKLGVRTAYYKERLAQLYDNKITIAGKFHNTEPMHHTCDRHHSWLATSEQMLCGAGCPRCKKPVEVKQFRTEYRNQKIVTRSKLEARGMRVFASKIGNYSGIRTSLDFPIPVLYGKKSPAFFHTNSGVIADVIKLKDFKKFVTKRKFEKSKERAEKMGLDYGVIIVGSSKAAGLWTMNWLTGEDKIPEDWNFEDLQLGNGNVRAPVLEV